MNKKNGNVWQMASGAGRMTSVDIQMSRRAAALMIALVSSGLWILLARAALGID